MFPVINRESVLSGFQWFFFIFCNTVVVPPTLLSAFHLPADNLLMLTQYAFLTTALACLVQAFCGHRRAIMEGPTGLWWGAILTITLGEASRGTPLNDIASSLSVGIAISAMVTIFIGISGLGHRLARLFTPAVMVFFMLLLGAQLTSIFFKGMLGLPFGIADTSARIKLAPFGLAVAVMCFILAMIIFLQQRISRYALLVGTVVGWGLWRLCFPSSHLPPGEFKLAMVSSGQSRHADAGYYCDGGDDGVSQHQQHLRRHPRYRYLLFASRVGQFSLSPKLYDFRTDDVSDGAFRGRAFFAFCVFHWFINANRRQFSQILYLW
ncbi:purine permease ybbY [Salmonella enterica subsp. enterica serovar Hartford]|nr:purine permease ybbY [Salmonella enterica subsp. enterica serovar Hartford]